VQLAPSEKRGEALIRLQIKTIFSGQTTPLTKLPLPYFLLHLYFSICTLNKTFSLKGEEAQNREENLRQKLGEPEPKTGGKLHPISIPGFGDRCHWLRRACYASIVVDKKINMFQFRYTGYILALFFCLSV